MAKPSSPTVRIVTPSRPPRQTNNPGKPGLQPSAPKSGNGRQGGRS